MKKNKLFIIIISVLVFFALIFTSLKICSLPVSSKNVLVKRIEVPSGTSAKVISKKLKENQLIRSSTVFYLCARYSFIKFIVTGNMQKFSLKSGVYNISTKMNLDEIFSVLSSGKQDFIRVSIPEGLTISKIANRLDSAGVCQKENFIQAAKNPELLAEYNLASTSFEGYLFPDTYFFTPSMTGESVVRLMVDNFFTKIKEIPELAEITPEKMHYVVTLASIVEREYRIDEEAPLIASVFTNRLRQNIGLYSCATVEYILTEIQGKEHPDKITYDDLSIDNPYNTYKWAGLPPGAISNPGLIALKASSNPPKTNYYFFRLVDEQKGKHVFTKDFETHISEGYTANTKKIGK